MEPLVAGAVLGAVYTEVQNVIMEAQSRNVKLKERLDRLKRTVESLAPRVEEAKYLDKRLANSEQVDMIIPLARQMETMKLSEKLEKAKKTVVECSELPHWNVWKRDRYCKRLEKMEYELLRFMQVHTQTDIWVEVRRALHQTRRISKTLNALGRLATEEEVDGRHGEAVTPAAGNGEKTESSAPEGGGNPSAEQPECSLTELRDRVAYLERAIQEKRSALSRRSQQLNDLLNDGGSSKTGWGRCLWSAYTRRENRHHLLELSLREVRQATDGFRRNIGGIGGFGRIFHGLLYGTKVAIKRIGESSHGEKEFEQEVEILSRVMHPNIVSLMGLCRESRCLCLVYEYVPNGTLKDHLRGAGGRTPLPWPTRLRIAAELCSALFWLHSMKPWSVFHRDLKPDNVLLDNNFHSKLGDFGISRVAREIDGTNHQHHIDEPKAASADTTLQHLGVLETEVCGTIGYMDPFYLKRGEYTSKSDLYGLGVTLLQLFTGIDPPFSSGPSVGEKWDRLRRVFSVDEKCHRLRRAPDGALPPEDPGHGDSWTLPDLVQEAYNKSEGTLASLMDPAAPGPCPLNDVMLLAYLGLQCCREKPEDRPNLETLWNTLQSYYHDP